MGELAKCSKSYIRDIHEYILVFSKGDYKREKGRKENSITKEQFMEWTKSIWTMKAESAKRIGHPAPFPEELPYRLIQMYSYVGDVVLDPFMGSGTTAVAALNSNRRFVGYDTNSDYIALANKRIEYYLKQGKINL